jgi:hypothetical protein
LSLKIKRCQRADEMYVFTLLYFSECEKIPEKICRFYLYLCIHFVRHCVYEKMQFELKYNRLVGTSRRLEFVTLQNIIFDLNPISVTMSYIYKL